MEWLTSKELVDYQDAVQIMEQRVADIQAGKATECVWLLEHLPLYTAGTSAQASDLINPKFPVYKTGRGGQYTYHGPGQRVCYVMLDLSKREKDIRCYVAKLEAWLQTSLEQFNIKAEPRQGRVGLWVETNSIDGFVTEEKIAAIGVRVRRWVTFHGIALNVHPDLSHFNGIVPCGLKEYGVTSMHKLGVTARMSEVDQTLQECFLKTFC